MSSPKKPAILQIIPQLETGGAEQTTLDVGQAIVKNGWTSIVVSKGGRMVKELETGGSTHFNLTVASKNPFIILINAFKLVRLIKIKRVSLLHARSRAPAWSALIAARYTKTPFVTTYHGAYKQASKIKRFYNSVMVRSDITIANSYWTRQFITIHHPNLPHDIVVIHRGTDFSEFQRRTISDKRLQKLRDQWSIQDDKKIVLCLARLTSIKGQSTLIEAMPTILETNPEAVLVLAGDDQGRTRYREKLECEIIDHDLSGNVVMPGHCSDPAAAFALSDLAIMASIQPETFGRTAVEAQALETPVIVTDIGAVGETVLAPPKVGDNERTGWRVPPGDAAATAKTIVAILNIDRENQERITRRAREYVLSNFSVENMCNKTLDVYAALLNNTKGGW